VKRYSTTHSCAPTLSPHSLTHVHPLSLIHLTASSGYCSLKKPHSDWMDPHASYSNCFPLLHRHAHALLLSSTLSSLSSRLQPSCMLPYLALSHFQSSLPEAVAIVMAPSKPQNMGIFRLTTPPGLENIRTCRRSGFVCTLPPLIALLLMSPATLAQVSSS
jgi:hypothetical protein